MIIKGLLTLGFIIGFVYMTSHVLTYFGALVAAFFLFFMLRAATSKRSAK